MSTKYTIMRLTQGGEKFEILVNPDLALMYKEQKKGDVTKILIVDEIFTDSKKGEKASAAKMESIFGTSDPIQVASIILEKAKLPLTSDQRQGLIEQKRKQIIHLISKTYVDPRTKLPHPPTRIQQAMEQVHLAIDPFKDAEEQVQPFVKALRPILPLSIEQISVAVKIQSQYATRAYGTVKDLGEIKKAEWQPDGSWIAVIDIPAAFKGEFLERVGKITAGSAEVKLLD
jgi:ribosome maturation protein SDO1